MFESMGDKMVVTLTVGELKAIILESVELALSKNNQSVPEEKLLKKTEVAKYFHVSIGTINDWMKRGKLPFYHVGSRVFFKHRDVMAALDNPVPMKKYGREKILCLKSDHIKKSA